jgi:hypothetical protein
MAIARERGESAYIGDGANRWAAVHRLDAALLVRLGIEKAPAGTVLHAVGEEGVTTRAIAEAFGTHLRVPVRSIERERAQEHFGFLGRFFGAHLAASNEATRALLGWTPTHAGLLDDLAQAGYFAEARSLRNRRSNPRSESGSGICSSDLRTYAANASDGTRTVIRRRCSDCSPKMPSPFVYHPRELDALRNEWYASSASRLGT